MTTKRGINLGCGRVIMPCERPEHHKLLPEFLYTDPDIQWDNADWNAGDGVNMVFDLFDYPWRVLSDAASVAIGGPSEYMLPSDTYDYAIVSHLVEHIPHHIVENGKFVHRHPLYQDGWFYWFSELNRILKPGGKAYILCPYAWSNSGMSDPTHTRYITLATLNYLIPNEGSPFVYRQAGRWKPIDYQADFAWTPHELGVRIIRETMDLLGHTNRMFTHGLVTSADWSTTISDDPKSLAMFYSLIWDTAQTNLNTITDIRFVMGKLGED